jgi:putative intracellular protease/amidase
LPVAVQLQRTDRPDQAARAGNPGIMRNLGGAFALALTFAALTSAAGAVNATLTPGATNPAVTQATVGSTICPPGYTKTVRNVSTLVKHAVYAEYGIPRSAQRNYVSDHLMPLEVGGGNDPNNLWPEMKAHATVKDKLEDQMHAAVCNGSVSLADAQARFLSGSAAGAPATQLPTTAPPAPAGSL